MIALYVQTVVLLAIAYFLGAALAYLIRRSLFKPALPAGAADRRVDPLPEFAAPPARAPAPAAPVATPLPKPAVPSAPGPAQDLRSIRRIDEAAESLLKRNGVSRYEHIAAWTSADVARFAQLLGGEERISRENWIEQAQVLAKGGTTEFARRRARGEIATAVPAPDVGRDLNGVTPSVAPILVRPQPSTGGAAAVVAEIIQAPVPLPAAAPPAAPPAAVVSPADVAARAAFSVETPRAAVPMRPQAPSAQDNLQRIGHIDAAIAQALGSHGVTRYAHIAQWSPAEVDRFNKLLDANGRISRENWIEQAQILSRGGDTAFSRGYDRQHGLAPASQPAPPAIQAARSVPAAPVAAEVRREPAAGAGVLPRPGATDDLKRIRGIGVLIEKKLNSMGIAGYETIANWSAADIDRVSQTLDFKGRIERENWVEQARILASGGATEFSRRVDRGEVETSRPRP